MQFLYMSKELRKSVCPYAVLEGSATGYHEMGEIGSDW